MHYNLLMMCILLHQTTQMTTAKKMVHTLAENINRTPLYLSNWAILYILQLIPIIVVAIVDCRVSTSSMDTGDKTALS